MQSPANGHTGTTALPHVPRHEIVWNTISLQGHRVFYLSCGPQDGVPIVLVHGWPELSWSWRHVLSHLGGMGFRAIAPDMRGYGRSQVYDDPSAYALRHQVADLIGLADALGLERAVWVGHDWGAPAVWSVASHNPDRCHGVANLCVPYRTLEFGMEHMLPLVDRTLYPEDSAPYGQWAYQRFYVEQFDRATSVMEADVLCTVRALFRHGKPEALGKPSPHADIFRNGGWFGGADRAPDLPLDTQVLTETDLAIYTDALSRNGFRGPNAYYLNDADNAAYSATALNGGRLDMPVLFLAGRYDITCESVDSRLAEPMRESCRNLTVRIVHSGHWMAQERPERVNLELTRWILAEMPHLVPDDAAPTP